MTEKPEKDRQDPTATPSGEATEGTQEAPQRVQVAAAAASLDIFATGGPAAPGAPPPAAPAPTPSPRPADEGPIGADIFATGGGAAPPVAAPVSPTPTASAPWQPVGHLAAGRYQILQEIGRGGMGRIYKAIDQRNDQEIAIKCLEAHLVGTEWSQQWLQELQMHQRLHHPNIAPMRELERDDQLGFFLTMDFIDGYDVAQALGASQAAGRTQPFMKKTSITLLKEVAAALDHAHAAGIVHLDIKPSNVLLQGATPIDALATPHGHSSFRFEKARLIDFGIAKLRAGGGDNQVMGTVYYMAPEQLSGSAPLTPAADIYALGIMAYQLLTGQLFQGGMPGPSGLNDQLSTAVDAVHEKAVAYRAEDRFQRAGAFIDALEQSLNAPAAKAVRLEEPGKEKVVTRVVTKVIKERGGDTVVQRPEGPTRSEQRWPQIKERIAQKRPGWLESPYPRKAPKVVACNTVPAEAFAAWPVAPQRESLILLDREEQPLLELCPIPAGDFTMGTHAKDRSARRQDKPQAKVSMGSFYMARTPITHRTWERFLAESHYKQPADAQHPSYMRHWDKLQAKSHEPQHPLCFISMIDAWAFCDFYGVALPSEAQWEYSLRGDDQRPYPWGTEEPTPNKPETMLAHIAQQRQSSMPVGAREGGASPFGILDGIGPVYQWVADEYDARWLRQAKGTDPVCLGKRREGFYSIRGASATTPATQAQLYRRHSASPDDCREDIGFRVCLDL